MTMKLIAPSSDDMIRSSMPTSHQRLARGAMSASGGYDVQPDCAAPPGSEEARQHDEAAGEVQPVAEHVQPRERHVGRADLQRHE